MTGHHPEQHAISPDMHDPPDAWHDHAHDQMPQHAHAEVANARMIIGVGVGLFFAVVVTVVIIYWFYIGYTTRLLSDAEGPGMGLEQDQRDHKNQVATEFQGFNWARQGDEYVKDTVQIPLELATKKVVAEYTAKR
ncbi:MAG: hypothetical protein AB7O77_01120 [Phycisphaerales bacterium]